MRVLNTPDVESVSNKPAAKLKADEVYSSDHTKIGKQTIATVSIYIGYTPAWRDSCYLDPEGEAQGMLNSMNPDK